MTFNQDIKDFFHVKVEQGKLFFYMNFIKQIIKKITLPQLQK